VDRIGCMFTLVIAAGVAVSIGPQAPINSQTVVQQADSHWYIVPRDKESIPASEQINLNRAGEFRYVEPLRGVRVDSNAINSNLPIVLIVSMPTGGTMPVGEDSDRIRRLVSVYRDFVIEGHADLRGAHSYNQRISKQRAFNVARILTESGAHNVSIRSFGDLQPVCRENTSECHDKNRRVVIRAKRRSEK